VGAGQPQRLVALHAPPPDERVLDGVVERVADVQGAGDVRRRADDAEGVLVAAAVGAAQAFAQPQLVPAPVDLAGRVLGGQRCRCGLNLLRHVSKSTKLLDRPRRQSRRGYAGSPGARPRWRRRSARRATTAATVTAAAPANTGQLDR